MFELKHKNLLLVTCWLVLAVVVMGADYASGPRIRFPIAFLLPVMFGAWYSGRVWALVFACVLPVIRLSFMLQWNGALEIEYEGFNTAIQILVLSALAVFVDRTARLVAEVKVLRGILPMCSFCRKIRDKDQQWIPLEKYIDDHSEAQISHGLCPSCYKKHYGEANGT